MTSMLRLFQLLLLCLAVMSGSVQMAVARGQAIALTHGGSMVVICTGYGVMTIALDAQGNPVGPVHPCPDCLAGLAAYLPPAAAAIVPVDSPAQMAQARVAARQPHALHVLVRRARGPPLLG